MPAVPRPRPGIPQRPRHSSYGIRGVVSWFPRTTSGHPGVFSHSTVACCFLAARPSGLAAELPALPAEASVPLQFSDNMTTVVISATAMN